MAGTNNHTHRLPLRPQLLGIAMTQHVRTLSNRLVIQIPMFLTVAREHDREGVLSIVTNEQGGPTHDIPNLSSADGREPGARDQVERQDQGTVTDRPSEGLDRNASGGDRLGGDVDEVAHSEGSRCECHFPRSTPARIEPFQQWKDILREGLLEMPSPPPIRPYVDSIPSGLPCLKFMLTIKSACNLLLGSTFDEFVCRKSPVLKTKLKTSTRA